MTLRELLRTADLEKIYEVIQKRDCKTMKDVLTIKMVEKQYFPVIKELLSKPKVKAHSMPFVVEDAIDPFDKTPFIDVYLRNLRYVKPPKGKQPWGGQKGKPIPKGKYNYNLNKYSERFSVMGMAWSKLIDTPIEVKSKCSPEEAVAYILWELTWSGWTEEKSKENNAKLMQKLNESAKEIKDGKCVTLPPSKKGGMKICIPDSVTQQIMDIVNKPVKRNKEPNTCKTCWGYGIWAMGDECPMGPMDASDGMPTKACPECGKNPNPYK